MLVRLLVFQDKSVREEEWELEEISVYEPHITLFEAPLDSHYILYQCKKVV